MKEACRSVTSLALVTLAFSTVRASTCDIPLHAEETIVNVSRTGDQLNPPLAEKFSDMNSSGTVVLVWQSPDASEMGIYGRLMRSDNTPISSEFQVNQVTAGDQQLPSVSINEDGRFVVAFEDTSTGARRAKVRIYNADATPASDEISVPLPTGQEHRYPKVGVKADGSFVVGWTGGVFNSYRNVYFQRYSAMGQTVGAYVDPSQRNGFNENPLKLAVAPDGRFVMVWARKTSEANTGIHARVYSESGSPLTNEFLVHPDSAIVRQYQSVGINNMGDFVISWEAVESGNVHVYVRAFDATGTPLFAQTEVDPAHTLGATFFSSAEIADDGTIAVMFGSNDRLGRGMFYSAFDAAGTRCSGPLRVNFLEKGTQEWGSVSVSPDSRVSFVWAASNVVTGQSGYELYMRGADAPPIERPDADRDCLVDDRETDFSTNPNLKDSDGDGFEDGVEVAIGSSPTNAGSPAANADADADGVPDAFDPDSSLADTDGDRFLDFYEIAAGSDPNDATSTPKLGDVDGNGTVDFVDALSVVNIYLGNYDPNDYSNPIWQDVDRDGAIEFLDAIMLFNYYLDNIPTLPTDK